MGAVVSSVLRDAKAKSFVRMSPTMSVELIRPRQLGLHRAMGNAVVGGKETRNWDPEALFPLWGKMRCSD